MKFKQYMIEKAGEFYSGKPLESGGTSIQGKVAPAIKWIFEKHEKNTNNSILDYGAGKYARNADWLRNNGYKTYAYDPFNYNGTEGWQLGSVSSAKPKEKLDIGFTSFVLNVVPKYIEEDILKEINQLSKTNYHVVRNKDIFDTVKKALHKEDKIVFNFFKNEYMNVIDYDVSTLTDEIIMDFCEFGVQTSRGFQRIPNLEDYGYKLIRKTSGFKIYKK